MFDGLLFERLITNPRLKALGFVLSTQVFFVEVWNAHAQVYATMTGIAINGAGGTIVTNPGSLPLLYAPDQSYVFTVTEPQDGASALDDFVTFVFTGEAGADFEVTGTRLTPFSIDIDWSQGFIEEVEYKTVVLKAWSDMEQRIQQRTVPRSKATYTVMTLTPQDSAHFDGLLWGWQHRIYGVPWWPDASTLAADLVLGSTAIPVTTTFKAYATGGLVMLWRGQQNWEVLTISTFSAGTVNLTSPTQNLWAKGTIVVPMKRGRLSGSQPLDRPANFVSIAQVAFECEVL
jgi:hypothetical protein